MQLLDQFLQRSGQRLVRLLQYEADGKSIVRAWTPIYRFDLDPAEARFYSHALPVLAQFNHAGKFPGGPG